MKYCACLSIIAALVASVEANHWIPKAGTPWQIVLSDALEPPYAVGIEAIDGDLYSNNASTWSDLKAMGISSICYFSAGSYEDWRPDADQFTKSDIGKPLKGWKGEWWIDTRSDNVRRIMSSRLDMAKQKGCDAVDPDNVDAYDNAGGGFGLSQDDAIDYVRFLAAAAHNRSMAIGLKNAAAIVDPVLDFVDFQVNEQCGTYGECSQFQPFIRADKPVFGIAYTKKENTVPSNADVSRICDTPGSTGFSTVIKHMSLGDWAIMCQSRNQSVPAPSPTPTKGSTSGCSGLEMDSTALFWLAALVALLAYA